MIEMTFRRMEKADYPVAEAINRLVANLSITGGDIKKILITSTHPREGKSFVSMNLAKALAGVGKRVVLVDADIRASALRDRYKVEITTDDPPYLGLVGFLSGRCGMESILGETSIDGLDLILSGKTVLNSFPLFNSSKMKELLDMLTTQYDIVLVDAPPIGTIIDAAEIAILCDGALMVVGSGEVSPGDLKDSVSMVEKVCPVLGFILNKAEVSDYKKKYYTYYSGSKSSKSSRT